MTPTPESQALRVAVALSDMKLCVERLRFINCSAERDTQFGDGWRCDYPAAVGEVEVEYQQARAIAAAGISVEGGK